MTAWGPPSGTGESTNGWTVAAQLAQRGARVLVAVLVLASLTADAGGLAPAAASDSATGRPLGVMTYNVDLGTDLAPLFAVTDTATFLARAHQAYQEMVDPTTPSGPPLWPGSSSRRIPGWSGSRKWPPGSAWTRPNPGAAS